MSDTAVPRPWSITASWVASGFLIGVFAMVTWATGWWVFEIVGVSASLTFCVVTQRRLRKWRKQRDQHRQAEEDHRDHGAGTGTSFAIGGTLTIAREGEAEGASPGVSLPVEQRDIPIVAWKQAQFMVSQDGRTVELRSTGVTHVHSPEEKAVCHKPRMYDYNLSGLYSYAKPKLPDIHDAPSPTCDCGFYALFAADKVEVAGPLVRMEVELLGRVIECEAGYRAERQRILGIEVDPECHGFLCDAPATVMCFPNEGETVPTFSISGSGAGTPHFIRHAPFPSCDEHVTVPKDRAVPLSPVAARLGIETRWART